MLDPEVWEHSSDYKPPPASTLRTVSIAATASVTPVVSPVPDEPVGFAAAPPLARRLPAAAFFKLYPDRYEIDLRGIDELDDEDPAEWGTVDTVTLPVSVTNDRLMDLLRLNRCLERLETDYEAERSYLDCAPDPDEFRGLRGCDRAERLWLEQRYEAALAAEAELENGLGNEMRAVRARRDTAQAALLADLFGPPPPPRDTVYVRWYATEIAIVGTVDDGISLDDPSLLTAADLPGDITNRDLLELLSAQAYAESPSGSWTRESALEHYRLVRDRLRLQMYGGVNPTPIVYMRPADGGITVVGTERTVLEGIPLGVDPETVFRDLRTSVSLDPTTVPVTNSILLEYCEAAEADKPALLAAIKADIAASR